MDEKQEADRKQGLEERYHQDICPSLQVHQRQTQKEAIHCFELKRLSGNVAEFFAIAKPFLTQ